MQMRRLFDYKSQCCGCSACVDVCTHQGIRLVMDREGFYYPRINRKNCVACGRCEKVCPIKHPIQKEDNPIYLGAQAKDDRIRSLSSSGGFFPVLARYVLSREGVVFGAAMAEDGSVYHRDIHDIKEISLLQKTKYVQSDMSGCYKKVKKYLEDGRLVLFTGTPCQCQAVSMYAGERKEQLFLADLVCYGVPSPGIWKKYIKELEKKYHGEFKGFCFRDKRNGDNGHTVTAYIGDKEYAYPMREDSFCRIYFRNYTIRPSCYVCGFSSVKREADITMGDFWGIEKVMPGMDDGMGTSMIILHTEKAKKVSEIIKKDFHYFQCAERDILQPRLCTPTPWSERRWKFKLLNTCLPVCTAEKILRK